MSGDSTGTSQDYFEIMGASHLVQPNETEGQGGQGSEGLEVSQEGQEGQEVRDQEGQEGQEGQAPVETSGQDAQQEKGVSKGPEAQFNWAEAFGEELDAPDKVKSTIETLRSTEAKLKSDLESAKAELNKAVNPFKDKNIKLANELYEKYGENALAMAGKLSSLKYDESDPIGTLVEAKVIENPRYSGHEAELRQKLEQQYGDLEEMSTIDRLELQDTAMKAVEQAKSLIPEIEWSDPDEVISRQNELRSEALSLKQDIAGRLSSFEFDGVQIPVANSSDLADQAVNMLVKAGEISEDKLNEVSQTVMYMAKMQALESGALQKAWAETKEAEIRAQILKEQENPSLPQKADGQDPTAGQRSKADPGIGAWAEQMGHA